MHFEAAISAANDLCTGFVNPVVENAKLLVEGDPSGRLADYDDTDINVSSANLF